MPPIPRSPMGALPCLLIAAVILYLYQGPYINPYTTVPLEDLPSPPSTTNNMAIDLSWHPPLASQINNLSSAINSTGTYDFIYNTSHTDPDRYGEYNWCNMPHVRKDIYEIPSEKYKLVYVELIHRHHLRTPYQSNTFPVEPYPWTCTSEGLFYYGSHLGSQPSSHSGSHLDSHPSSHAPARTYWAGYTSPINPFVPSGFAGDCQFPQITDQGLSDSFTHGQDLWAVYGRGLGFLPDRHQDWQGTVRYRVTNNQITSQVASQIIAGMWKTDKTVPLAVQRAGVDSLEPQYSCPAADGLYTTIKTDAIWMEHLQSIADLYDKLDDISGVARNDSGWHAWVDHYYDNLSARECHARPLPCKLADGRNSTECVTREMADEVYRVGQWEYSRLYRDSEEGMRASVASFGIWVAELAGNLRVVMAGDREVRWRQNVAHDGSVSRLLSILQVERMVWPGMGSEVVFEVYEKGEEWFVRVLFGGRTLRSSNPSLGVMEMVPMETLLGYFDGLVGRDAGLVLGLCKGTG